MYQIFLLDIDNTLLDFDAAEERSFKEAIESFSLTFHEEMLDQYKKINKNLWDLLEQGKVSKDTIRSTRFFEFFRLYDLDIDGLEAEERYQTNLSNSADIIPHAKETLEQLKKAGKQLYTASNGVYTTQIRRLEKAGLLTLFDGMFISEKIGFEKPSPNFFNYCFDHIPEFQKEKTIMVGDSLTSDIQGAQGSGIDSCLFRPAKTATPGRSTHTIYDLTELLQF